MKIGVLDDYDNSIALLECWHRLNLNEVTFFSEKADPYQLEDYEILVLNRERTILDRSILNHLKKLKHVALTGRISGQVDLEALKERQVAVSYTEGSGQAAAELTIALILGVTKRIMHQHASVQSGGWQVGPAMSLFGKTLGILGLGRIGSKVAQFGKLMGMNVISWGPTEDQGRSEKLGIARLELTEVMSKSDVLTICLRLSDKTRNLLGKRELDLLKNGACIVNTARAEMIRKNDLYSALESGRIQGAFDVFHFEPLPKSDPIRSFPNVLLSPHMGYVTHDVYDVFFPQVVENILAWQDGRKFKNALEAN